MMKTKIRTFTETEGASPEALTSQTVGELIDNIRDQLTDYYHTRGTLPLIGYFEFLGDDGKLYVVWLDPVVMEVDESVARNPVL